LHLGRVGGEKGALIGDRLERVAAQDAQELKSLVISRERHAQTLVGAKHHRANEKPRGEHTTIA
jgi:hypothetical protein